MPPTFPYVFAFGLWLLGAILVWFASAILFLCPRTRSLGRPLALAMTGTFPGVFAYQVVAAVPAFLILLIGHAFWRVIEQGPSTQIGSALVAIVSLACVGLAFLTVLSFSLMGFFEGWRVGWFVGRGRRLREEIQDTLLMVVLAALVSRILRRRQAV